MKNLPKSIQIVPKWVKNFDQNLIILKLIAKVVEFRQIWSHWLKDNFIKSNSSSLFKTPKLPLVQTVTAVFVLLKGKYVSTMPSTKQNIGCVCCSNETK